jgi:hypothetical protein
MIDLRRFRLDERLTSAPARFNPWKIWENCGSRRHRRRLRRRHSGSPRAFIFDAKT